MDVLESNMGYSTEWHLSSPRYRYFLSHWATLMTTCSAAYRCLSPFQPSAASVVFHEQIRKLDSPLCHQFRNYSGLKTSPHRHPGHFPASHGLIWTLYFPAPSFPNVSLFAISHMSFILCRCFVECFVLFLTCLEFFNWYIQRQLDSLV